jgi:hypothetical protein
MSDIALPDFNASWRLGFSYGLSLHEHTLNADGIVAMIKPSLRIAKRQKCTTM